MLHTGHWLIDTRDDETGGSGATLGATASTTVHFARLTDAEIEDYVGTGEPLRVAGAFTLDGLGGPFVSGIEGTPATSSGSACPCCASCWPRSGSPGTVFAYPRLSLPVRPAGRRGAWWRSDARAWLRT